MRHEKKIMLEIFFIFLPVCETFINIQSIGKEYQEQYEIKGWREKESSSNQKARGNYLLNEVWANVDFSCHYDLPSLNVLSLMLLFLFKTEVDSRSGIHFTYVQVL